MNCLILLLLLCCCGNNGGCLTGCGNGDSCGGERSCKRTVPCGCNNGCQTVGNDSCGCKKPEPPCGCVPPRPEPRNDCRMDRMEHDSCGYTPFPSPGSTCGCEDKQN